MCGPQAREVAGQLRLWVVSDLHTHHHENMRWVEHISGTAFVEDILIVAGDVSDDLAELRHTLLALKSRFRQASASQRSLP